MSDFILLHSALFSVLPFNCSPAPLIRAALAVLIHLHSLLGVEVTTSLDRYRALNQTPVILPRFGNTVNTVYL